jgi:4-hydroxy-3-polyprenylbenzoate decarboxylase
MKVMRGRTGGLDYSAFRPDADPEERRYPGGSGASALLIDATMKWPYPPISLPKKEYMEHALEIWKDLGLETLRLKSPWFGYNLGYWTKDDEENADLILKGDYRAVGKKMLQVR